MVKFGYDLRELYEYSCKELLFILKYRREGLAYELYKNGFMTRLAFHGKKYPDKIEEILPELFEKQTVKLQNLPKEITEMYQKQLQRELDTKYQGR